MIWDPNLRPKVFVVDSSPNDYEQWVESSNRAGTQVVFFESGRAALQALAAETPAMWIVNLRLSDMSGADLQSMLRTGGCRAPIALVGDEYRPSDEITARCAGADLYFAKPIPYEVLDVMA